MMDFILTIVLHTLISFVASTAFAIIFHAPKIQRYFAGLTGAFGWFIYLLLTHFGLDTVVSSFFATIGLAIIARIFSYKRCEPVTTFLITGVFPLVPGAGIYSTGYSVFMGDKVGALSTGLVTIEVAIVMAIGMGIVLSMPQILFSFRRKRTYLGGTKF